MKNFYIVVTLFAFILSANLSACSSKKDAADYGFATERTEDDTVSTQITNQKETAQVAVYVCGAVRDPGVYVLSSEDRICDAIDFAGGMRNDAKVDYWNLAQKLEDGMKIYVPTEEEAKDMTLPENDFQNTSNNGKININTADKEELKKLPGIGDTRAERILQYRQEHGRFSEIMDLMKVSGIKESIYKELEDYITVN